MGPGCSLPHCEPDFQYPAHFRSSFPSEQMWEGGKSCSLNEQGSVTAEPGAGGFFPQGRWSGGQGAPCSSCSSHGKWGSVLLPSLWHANHSPKKEKHFQVVDIPFRTQRCSRAPVQIHKPLPVRALQPVIILRATIKTIETHVMGLGSIAWLIPTSIPRSGSEEFPGCWCFAGQVGTKWSCRAPSSGRGGGSSRVPRQCGTPGVTQAAVTRLWELQEGPPAPHPTSALPRVTQKVSDRKDPILTTFRLSSDCKLQHQNTSSSFSRVSPGLGPVSSPPFPMSDTNIKLCSHTAPSPFPTLYCSITPLLHFMSKISANICDALLDESQGKSSEMKSEELHEISLTSCAHHFLIYLFFRNHYFCYFSESIALLEPYYTQFSALLSLRIGF